MSAEVGEQTALGRETRFSSALILTVFWVLPIALLVMSAMKTPIEFSSTSTLTPPSSFNLFDNIARAWAKGMASGFVNSAIYGVVASLIAVILSAMAAYGIVRLRIPQGMFWFLLIYSGTIFPFQMYLIPLFNFYLDTGLYDTRLGVIAFYVAITIPFCVFVMRGFFLTVPWQVQEAAALDGANSWATFWRIMMPMAKAPLILLVLIQFTWIWNDLLFGLVLTKSESVRPIMVALAGMQGVYGASDGPSVIAATLVGSAPTLILFLVLQRYFVRGLTLGMGER
ncbi:carbohydrate ABC transporter permease [Kaistia geumhonensis]|uniref:Multiple sugar transport system permease protein n=1 Tax=Kaistia geumhonensis TaxID=410839 RepID=A0ABU0M7E9_9HYPH|nr:carbohydrate ABC transporter permease [Kaistia geumhonensis]MCX5477931.1 carbohydrate ABC transporter permease [Kaistia geumhonensis]MDQ0516856.1 multiple sugar transport system permease protein [Kaistia geumhonensis]